MSIKDILFGQKKFFETVSLGIFDTRIRNEKTTKSITWSSSIKIESYSDEIVILLEGDSQGPEKKQLEGATWIIQNLKNIDKELTSEINQDPKLSRKFQNKILSDLRLSCLNPWHISLNSFELSYESTTDEDFRVSIIVQNKKILEIL